MLLVSKYMMNFLIHQKRLRMICQFQPKWISMKEYPAIFQTILLLINLYLLFVLLTLLIAVIFILWYLPSWIERSVLRVLETHLVAKIAQFSIYSMCSYFYRIHKLIFVHLMELVEQRGNNTIESFLPYVRKLMYVYCLPLINRHILKVKVIQVCSFLIPSCSWVITTATSYWLKCLIMIRIPYRYHID